MVSTSCNLGRVSGFLECLDFWLDSLEDLHALLSSDHAHRAISLHQSLISLVVRPSSINISGKLQSWALNLLDQVLVGGLKSWSILTGLLDICTWASWSVILASVARWARWNLLKYC